MSVKEDSGSSSSVSSTPQALSPQLDVLQTFMENGKLMENMFGTQLQQAAYQQAMQMDLFGQMQLMGLMNMAPVAPNIPPSAEMQRLLMDNFSENYNANLLAQQQLMLQQMMLMNTGGASGTTQIGQMHLDPRILSKMKDDSPLDLSGKKDIGLGGLNLFSAFDCLKKSDDSGFRDEKGGKRNYSQMDLNAAVNDIRNGKLGTRRASVVYGIPRSTLRNKIYKLEGAEAFNKRKKQGQVNAEITVKKIQEDDENEKLMANSPSDSNSPSEETTAPETPASNATSNEQDKEPVSNINGPLEISKLWGQNDIWSVFNVGQNNTVSEALTPSRSRKSKNSDPDRKIRPKRGQYRKYDKTSLDQAVQSVRSGEMSVHRAGSYYGVPHSTLEYKVKERNLMRKKKLEEGANSPASEQTEKSPDPDSSAQGDTSAASAQEPTPEMSPELALGNLLEQFTKIQKGIPNLFDVIST